MGPVINLTGLYVQVPVCNILLSSNRPSLLAEFEHCSVCLDAQKGR